MYQGLLKTERYTHQQTDQYHSSSWSPDHACFGKWYTPTEWKTELGLDKERKPQVICVDGAGNFRFGPFNKKKGAEDNLRQFKHLYNNVEWQ